MNHLTLLIIPVPLSKYKNDAVILCLQRESSGSVDIILAILLEVNIITIITMGRILSLFAILYRVWGKPVVRILSA